MTLVYLHLWIKMLRLLFVVSCLFVGNTLGNAVDKELQLWFMKNGVECSKEYPVTMEEFEDLKKHKIPDTKNAKCLLACVFKKINWMNDKGLFEDEAAYSLSKKKYTDPAKLENARKLYDICKKVNDEKVEDGAAGCDRAKILAKCLMQNSAKLGFLNAD